MNDVEALTTRVQQDLRWTKFRLVRPEWDIRITIRPDPELIDWDDKIIWLGVGASDWEYRIAHALIHVRLHPYGYSSRFTPGEEDEAHWGATMWLAWGPDTPLPQVAGSARG